MDGAGIGGKDIRVVLSERAVKGDGTCVGSELRGGREVVLLGGDGAGIALQGHPTGDAGDIDAARVRLEVQVCCIRYGDVEIDKRYAEEAGAIIDCDCDGVCFSIVIVDDMNVVGVAAKARCAFRRLNRDCAAVATVNMNGANRVVDNQCWACSDLIRMVFGHTGAKGCDAEAVEYETACRSQQAEQYQDGSKGDEATLWAASPALLGLELLAVHLSWWHVLPGLLTWVVIEWRWCISTLFSRVVPERLCVGWCKFWVVHHDVCSLVLLMENEYLYLRAISLSTWLACAYCVV